MLKIIYKWLPIIFGCHCRSDRSFYLKNKKFPICSRCTGELIGILFSYITFSFFNPNVLIDIFLMLPLIIDGFIQLKTVYESNNIKRLITGILFGYGLCNLFIKSIIFTLSCGYKFGEYISK